MATGEGVEGGAQVPLVARAERLGTVGHTHDGTRDLAVVAGQRPQVQRARAHPGVAGPGRAQSDVDVAVEPVAQRGLEGRLGQGPVPVEDRRQEFVERRGAGGPQHVVEAVVGVDDTSPRVDLEHPDRHGLAQPSQQQLLRPERLGGGLELGLGPPVELTVTVHHRGIDVFPPGVEVSGPGPGVGRSRRQASRPDAGAVGSPGARGMSWS